MQKVTINAVYDDDLENLLRNLNIYHDFISRKLKCIFCNTVITSDSLHSLFPESGSIKLCCDKPECVKKLILRLEKINE